jgi:hypothetical protein
VNEGFGHWDLGIGSLGRAVESSESRSCSLARAGYSGFGSTAAGMISGSSDSSYRTCDGAGK